MARPADTPTDQGEQTRQRLLAYLTEFEDQNGYLPSIWEMGREMGMRPNGVKWHLGKLEEQGKVTFTPSAMSRSLRLVR